MRCARVLSLLSALVLCASSPAFAQASAPPAMVVLVRHAEKAAQPADDPPLTVEGVARAKALAEAVEDARITAIITTQWVRTRETAAPLASSSRIVPEVVPTGDTRAHAEAVASAVRRHPGGVVLVVGHSDTIPAIIAALGGPRLPDICSSAFDDLFVLVPSGGPSGQTPRLPSWSLLRSRYGAPSSRAACR